MTYDQNLWLFFILLTGIIAVPGMDMVFVLANALAGGRRAGLAATFGMMAGGICHTLFGTIAVVGLSRLLPAVSGPMLMIGSAYMIWIGISLMRSAIVVDRIEGPGTSSLVKVCLQAIVTCLLNPKAWLFILAVYPQFMKPTYGPLWSQAVVMGVMTMLVQFVIYGGLASAAALARDNLVSNPRVTIWLGRATGICLAAIASSMLVAGWRAL